MYEKCDVPLANSVQAGFFLARPSEKSEQLSHVALHLTIKGPCFELILEPVGRLNKKESQSRHCISPSSIIVLS